jgi:hypothetical protein
MTYLQKGLRAHELFLYFIRPVRYNYHVADRCIKLRSRMFRKHEKTIAPWMGD